MAFSILDHIANLEPSEHAGKYICPACGGNDFSVNEGNGAYNCFNDSSPQHRAEIRNVLAPLTRWERPERAMKKYTFPYENQAGERVLEVNRDDTSGKKNIFQTFVGIPEKSPKRSKLIKELRSQILPYRYKEAIAKARETQSPIFVSEGELCCDRLWEIGLPSVTFLGGSGQYRSNGNYSGLFKGIQLILCPDRDEPGVALMREVAADNPTAKFLYADPESFEWESLPRNGGYDVADWLDDGADKDLLLASITTKDRHAGNNGRPSYEEIMSNFERIVGTHTTEARITWETREWLTVHDVKMSASEVDKLLNEAKGRVHGREELEVMDAKTIAMSEESRSWTIAGILPEASVMLLAAAPGSGKSTLLYNWAVHVATGTPWSGRRCKRGHVLVIQCDEPTVDACEKMQVIGYDQNDELDIGDIGFIDRWRFNNIPQLVDYIRKNKPQLIVIDSLTSCLAGMQVDLIRSDAGNCIYELRDIANDYNTSIVILHHLNKMGGIRDSSSFEANVSEVVKLYRQENNFDPAQFIFEWTKSRSGLTGKHFLSRDPATYGWSYRGPVDGGRENLDRLVDYINNNSDSRFDRHRLSQVFPMEGSVIVGRLAEQARRQGLVSSSFELGPDNTRTRMYHSFAYRVPELDSFTTEPTASDDMFETTVTVGGDAGVEDSEYSHDLF